MLSKSSVEARFWWCRDLSWKESLGFLDILPRGVSQQSLKAVQNGCLTEVFDCAGSMILPLTGTAVLVGTGVIVAVSVLLSKLK